jgi:hypothetical protein
MHAKTPALLSFVFATGYDDTAFHMDGEASGTTVMIGGLVLSTFTAFAYRTQFCQHLFFQLAIPLQILDLATACLLFGHLCTTD